MRKGILLAKLGKYLLVANANAHLQGHRENGKYNPRRTRARKKSMSQYIQGRAKAREFLAACKPAVVVGMKNAAAKSLTSIIRSNR